MLKHTEPFRSLLWGIKILGFWETNSLSPRHIKLAALAFTVFHVVEFIHHAVSLFVAECLVDLMRLVIVLFLRTKLSAFVISFWWHQNDIKKLFKKLDENFHEHPESLSLLTRECQKAKKIGIFKLVFMIIGIFMGSISSFLASDIPSPL
jgi:hypothetical protein